MNWETGVDIYTLLILCIKSTMSKDLLNSTGNSTQCSVVKLMGRKPKKQGYLCVCVCVYVYIYIYIYMIGSHYCTAEIDTAV